jgi:hypothetical protein
MNANLRFPALALALACAAIGAAPAPAGASAFAVEKWEAGTCIEKDCTDAGSSSLFYTQAAGHPNVGITDFRFTTSTVDAGLPGFEYKVPEGHVKNVRVDLPPGLAVNPEATGALCTEAELNADNDECPSESQVGEDEATGTAEVLGVEKTVTEDFPVYNMVRKPGEPSRFGVEINSSLVKLAGVEGHTYLEGGLSWRPEAPDGENSGVASGDYHEFFEIREIPTKPELIESKLIFWGVPQEHQEGAKKPPTAFITLPSTCSSKQITYLHVDSYGEPENYLAYSNETPVTATGCEALAFDPKLSLAPETTQSDRPDGVTTQLHVPQLTGEPSKPNSPDVQNAKVTLPEGMTLNPSAANGLEACSGGMTSGECPAASQVGAFEVDAPGIPNGSLTGGVYVGSPEAGKSPESGGEYRIFLIGEAAQYGVGLRLEGRVSANEQTGRLTATFSNAPQVPFENLILRFRGGPRAPLANPLSCGPAEPSAAITPYGGEPAKAAETSGFVVDANGAGEACPSSLPFSLKQSLTPASPAHAGEYDQAAFSLSRGEGEQYLSKISTTLPEGLLGAIPSVTLCGESEANAGTCPSSSQIGAVSVTAGAGSEPYAFSGLAYLTGPYDGDPYGLSVVVPAVAGPYDLGDVNTRAGISVGMYNGRVTLTATLPSIVGGVPLRLRSLSVSVNRSGFMFNPTSCGEQPTESLFTSSANTNDSLATPFQVSDCGALAFQPSFSASTGSHSSKLDGASIQVKVTQPAGRQQANISELQMQLPKQLVARLSTLQKACTAAEFETGPPPGACKPTARVGSVTVSTPVLPGQLTGSVYFVSHGAEAFPDLDLVLNGDGVEVVLVGHTHIAHSSVTTSTFENLPDVPISSVTVTLPMASNSAVAATGRLCDANLVAPTTIIAHNGAKIVQNTTITVSGCPVLMLAHHVRHGRLIAKLWVPEAGRVRIGGRATGMKVVRVKRPGEITVSVRLSSGALAALHRRHGHGPKLRVGFVPASGHNTSGLTLELR